MKRSSHPFTLVVALTVVTVLLAGSLPGLVGAETGTVQNLEGAGTQEDPYVITNATELQSMNEDLDAHYVLGNDVDASETSNWNGGEGFEPIGDEDDPFTGTFDGKRHVIEGLTIRLPRDDEVGMFGVSSGTVRNVHLEDARVEGLFSTGTLIGLNNGDVRNVSASGEVTSDEDQILGGLVGYSEAPESSIHAATSSVTVTNGDVQTGGLVGASNGEIVNSYALGDVSGEGGGALVGRNGASRAVFSAGTVSVTDDERGGGLAGWNQGTFVDAYWDVEATGQSDGVGMRDSGGTGLGTAEMTGAAARQHLDGFDFDGTWAVTDRYPVLRWQVDALAMDADRDIVTVGNDTNVSVRIDLVGDRTVGVTSVADVSTEDPSIAALDGRTITAEGVGETQVTATHADTSVTSEILVIAAEGISAIDAETSADEVMAGDTVEITGTFRNVDENETFHDAELTANGEPVTTANVTVAGDSDGEHTFEWTPEDAGTYNLSIDGIDAGTVDVTAPSTETASGSNAGETGDADASTQSPTDSNDGGAGGLSLPLIVVGILAIGSVGVLAGRRL